jgi:hypothetical protein
MSDRRRARRAQQVRRDARRAKKRVAESSIDTALWDAIRGLLARGHPLDLLGLASAMIQTTRPEPFAYLKSRQRDTLRLEDLVAGFVGVRVPEATVFLAILADLIVDDEDSQVRCRRAVADRGDALPRWLVELQHVEVYRAVRMTHVLGDRDDLLIGARFADGQELTCVAVIDHNMASEVKDAFFVPDSIDEVLAATAERIADPDTSFVDMGLADARAWISHGLEQFLPILDSVQWPHCRPLVQWLIEHLPQGGTAYQSPGWDWEGTCAMVDRFFASVAALPFNRFDHRELLLELLDTGTGDPLRWSAERVERAIGGKLLGWDRIPLDVALDAPDLLRAFIPYAHAQSGIRDELTSETLAMVDALRSSYKREVLREAKFWDLDDAV